MNGFLKSGLIAAIGLIVMFPSVAFGADLPGGAVDAAKFSRNQNIWFMLMLVAFLMLFIRKFEWGICLATVLSASSSFLAYMAIQEFIIGQSPAEVWSQNVMIGGVTCAITLVIAIGVFIGTIPSWLYLLAGVFFAPAYAFLEYLLFEGLPAALGGPVTDPGGGILVHLFAAYWGLGVALAIREKRAFDEPMHTSKHSLSLAWLAAMLLFILWPSFVTALTTLEETTPVMANCYMSGLGSMISAYLTCRLMSRSGKINPLVFIYAMLAGPVGSSSSLLLAGPWQSLLIGLIAGALSALAFIRLQGWLNKKLGVVDIMGVHQLHGVGGWVSLVSGAVFAASAVNILAGAATLAWGLLAGLGSGLILRSLRGSMEVILSDEAEFEGYNPDPRSLVFEAEGAGPADPESGRQPASMAELAVAGR